MTGADNSASQYAPCSFMFKDRVDENLPVPLSEHESFIPPSNTSPTVSCFGGRLDASIRSPSSLRTISSWQSSLHRDARKKYAKIRARHDSEDTNAHNQRGGMLASHSQYSSSSNMKHLVNFPRYFSHATTATNGNNDQSSSQSSSSSSCQSSFGDCVPFPSTSEESYPSPYSADAIAVFQAPSDKGGARYFEDHEKYGDILENQIQVVFSLAVDGTSTSSGHSFVPTAPRSRGLLKHPRRRLGAWAKSLLSTRRKFLTVFSKERRAPHFDDCDYNSVEYDIPCLAYISCLW
jgi:hypothetical protein